MNLVFTQEDCLMINNKKVLVRERKRHTASRVASTPYVVLTGYPPDRVPPVLTWPGGVPTWVPPSRVPPQLDLAWYPPGWTWHGTPPGWTWQGTPPQLDLAWYLPPQVSAPWHSGKCCKALWDMGTPTPGCEQTNKVKLLPSRRTTYAGGNNVT